MTLFDACLENGFTVQEARDFCRKLAENNGGEEGNLLQPLAA